MPKQSSTQKEVMEDVMHEYKQGDLKSGSGDKVKSRKQAIAIGLKEAGASKYESKSKNKRNLKHTLKKKKSSSKSSSKTKTKSSSRSTKRKARKTKR